MGVFCVKQTNPVSKGIKKSTHAHLHALGHHIIQGRISKEGVGQPALKFDIFRVFTFSQRELLCQREHPFIAGQFNGRGHTIGFTVRQVGVQVISCIKRKSR